MRKVVLYTLMSLDGCVDEPSQYFPDEHVGGPPTFDAMMDDNENAVIARQDTVLLGRHMYDEWSQYWPTVRHHPFADFINTVTKYVVTSTPLTRTWDNSHAAGGSVAELVGELKARPGGDIGVHGSITLAQSLLAAGLVDEVQLVVAPAVGFSGRRLFAVTDDIRRLELVNAASTPTGGLLLAYRLNPGTG